MKDNRISSTVSAALGAIMLATLLGGCATGQPARPTGPLTETEQLRAIALRVTRAYSWYRQPPAIVIEPRWAGVQSNGLQIRLGGALLAGTTPKATPPLTPVGGAAFAHELGHYVLRHAYARQCDQLSTRYQCEVDANVEAVRISAIAWGLTHAQAVALVDAKMLDTVAGQLAGEAMTARDPGHKHACLEARDFRARFPAEAPALPVLPAGCAAITE
jgi:hypothetical protein